MPALSPMKRCHSSCSVREANALQEDFYWKRDGCAEEYAGRKLL